MGTKLKSGVNALVGHFMSDRVIVQRSHNGKRWAYVITDCNGMAFVSPARYGSADSAKRAGEKDLEEMNRFIAGQDDHDNA